MPFSHHSHSGQFCGHAVNTLQEVVQDAIKKGMTTFCLTEHMPREEIDFYPEESKSHTTASLTKLYDDFYREARRLQKSYADQIQLFVGFEGEWTRPSTVTSINQMIQKYKPDLFVGSVHHVHTIPIDYDVAMYQQARTAAGGTDEQIFADYFDAQYEMLQALKPPVVGHFDLIRLKSDNPNRSFEELPAVWKKVVHNLEFIASYGGVIELNSSSLRKGMTEAYPQVDICKEFLRLGGRFTLSDDSHGIEHVGLNYDKVLECIEKAGIKTLHYLAWNDGSSTSHDERFLGVQWAAVEVSELKKHVFWTR